ncbi:hypothetical protein IJL65_04980 [bacterium]|nr:hypothetical protein [bacterium]
MSSIHFLATSTDHHTAASNKGTNQNDAPGVTDRHFHKSISGLYHNVNQALNPDSLT